MDIIAHNFNSINIDQLVEASMIGGCEIPAGYVNATQLCKVNNKRLANWTRLDSSKAYIDALSLDTHICVSRLLIELKGTPNGDASLQGTWVHPEVAIDITRWISPEFAVWANRVLRQVINGDFKALTPEAIEAQEQLKEIWKQVRADGKVARRALTDAIRDWYDRNPDGTTCPQPMMYAKTTNAIYQALWGKTALEIESLLGCDRNQSRNCMNAPCLRVLEHSEDRVVAFIDEDNLKPTEAVTMAGLRKARIELG